MKSSTILIGVATILTIGGGFLILRSNPKRKSKTQKEQDTKQPAPVQTPNNLDVLKVLSKGTKGPEVLQLQVTLAGLTPDGIFGAKTESRLQEVLHVKFISLAQMNDYFSKVDYINNIRTFTGKNYNYASMYGFEKEYLKNWANALKENKKVFKYLFYDYSTETGKKITIESFGSNFGFNFGNN